mgnify:CR=1 FL=1
MKWTVEFLNGMVEEEFHALPVDLKASILRIATLIRDGIARSIYVAVAGRRVVIVRSFVKKTQQTPKDEIKIALKRAKEVL